MKILSGAAKQGRSNTVLKDVLAGVAPMQSRRVGIVKKLVSPPVIQRVPLGEIPAAVVELDRKIVVHLGEFVAVWLGRSHL